MFYIYMTHFARSQHYRCQQLHGQRVMSRHLLSGSPSPASTLAYTHIVRKLEWSLGSQCVMHR